MITRLGAVSYLNARPLAYGLDFQPDRFSLRFDVPSACASLLHARDIDFGLVPSIEFCRGDGLAIVPGAAVVSDGAVDSVAIFTTKPIERVQTLALDTSSRTSAALVRVLCDKYFAIRPRFEPMGPDLTEMLTRCDAALLIGDPALFLDARAFGVDKIDLGEAWTTLTGLPFVWAFWAGPLACGTPDVLLALRDARERGVAAIDGIAAAHDGGDLARRAKIAHYLRQNIKYDADERAVKGLRQYYAWAGDLGLVPPGTAPRFFECAPAGATAAG